MTEDPRFTPSAARRWAELSGQFQTHLLNKVWCCKCRTSTTIVHFHGEMKGIDLLLQGECINCKGPVARLIEGM